MKKIAITGGKGGTGKSTYSTLLFSKFLQQGKKAILVDCDVECPNDYLLLGQKLKKPASLVHAYFPHLIKAKCQKCGRCVEVCRSNAIFQAPNQYPVFFHELCSACGACSLVCPHKAIQKKETQTGQIYVNKIQANGWSITGSANPGLEETSPVVAETKKFALAFAKDKGADVILFDTAPGTHCPVIMALLENDFAYVVTEPTPLGNHDLALILELIKKLKIPAKIVLNQADLGVTGALKQIDLRIPYSRKLAVLYSRGQMLNKSLLKLLPERDL